MHEPIFEQWWLARLGDHLIWSRLRLRDSGTAEVFDSSGTTLSYDSEDSARAALLDAEFRALDGLDEDDAAALGLPLEDLVPPSGEDAELPPRMSITLPSRH
ncbi:MAG: hypothetical protein KDI69_05885 [Xanthomonadales bacterium]|jgi:hypothetical protein|nr:hypothetical protein [Xanthomonadales bacterium]